MGREALSGSSCLSALWDRVLLVEREAGSLVLLVVFFPSYQVRAGLLSSCLTLLELGLFSLTSAQCLHIR